MCRLYFCGVEQCHVTHPLRAMIISPPHVLEVSAASSILWTPGPDEMLLLVLEVIRCDHERIVLETREPQLRP